MNLAQLTIGKYRMIGRILAREHPEMAKQLLDQVTFPPPVETDQSKIDHYFSLFCQFRGIDYARFALQLKNSEKVYNQRIFLAAMLHLYMPHLFAIHPDDILMPYGLTVSIATAIGQKKSNVSTWCRQVRLMEKVYDEFREDVRAAVEYFLNLNSPTNGKNETKEGDGLLPR